MKRWSYRGSSLLPLLVSAIAVVAVVVGGATAAQAHSSDESYVYLEVFDDTIEGRVEYPPADLSAVLGIDVPDDATAVAAAVAANLEAIQRYTAENFAIGSSGEVWEVVFEDFDVLTEGSLTVVVIPFAVDRTFDPMPRVLDVTYSGIISEIPERSALLLIATDWRSGTFNNAEEHIAVFDSSNPTLTVDLGESSLGRAFVAVVGLGVEHIQIGTDHILFIVALLLPAVLFFYPGFGWRPARSFGASLWRIVKIATSFTIAHTITLTLGGLGVIEISPLLVEPVIAISIALAALHNLRPVFYNREWVLAFAFGLFHGFGFAGLLGDLGLDRSNRIVSLLGFNLGIELGQLAIIVAVFPALFLLRRTRVYLPLLRVGSVVLIAIATAWFIERVFDIESFVTTSVERVLQWPRPLFEVLALAVFAAIVYLVEASRDRLLDAGPPTGTEDRQPASVEAGPPT